MKIGILTIFTNNHNYGGMLQAYALQRVIRNMGYDAVTINHRYGKNPIYPNLLARCRQYSFSQIISKIREKRLERRGGDLIADKLTKRNKLFATFSKEYIVQSKMYYNAEAIGNDYQILLVGSDQVWNPNVICPLLMLDIPTKARKVAYAASIGRGVLTKREKTYMTPRIKAFNHVSVREQSAKVLLNDIECTVVLDPTLLLDKKQWEEITAERIIAAPYVLMYSFSDCHMKSEIKHYWEQQGRKVIFIPYAKQAYNEFDSHCDMEPMWYVGPREFLSLVRYADHIYTDSFHGMVFSILFEREFTVYERNRRSGSKVSMNSRIYDLLETFGLQNRLSRANFVNPNGAIDYKIVTNLLKTKRAESIIWLKNALK